MSRTTKNTMRRVEGKLDRIIQMAGSHCGHDADVAQMLDARDSFLVMVKCDLITAGLVGRADAAKTARRKPDWRKSIKLQGSRE